MPAKPQIISASDADKPSVTPSLVGFSDTAEKVSANTAKVASATTETVTNVAKDATAKFAKTAEVATAQAKEQFDALVQASTIVAKGAEEVSREVSAYVQASMTGAAAATKAMLTAATLKDMVEIQSNYLKSSFDTMVSNSSKISEIGVRVATEAWSPIASRMQAGVEKMVRPAA